jgi:hypothetical protein
MDMKAELSPAVDALRAQLREQLAEADETKKMINSLLRRMGEEPEFGDSELDQRETTRPSIGGRADQYYGKPFATAAQEYLERRKQACSAEEILRGLEQGGFDFRQLNWKENDRKRSLAISLAKNNQKFHKLPNNTFGLVAWYPSLADRNGNG